ncbi:hypothetical protein ACFL67_03520 [candidate division KSB1 bacterium]
MMLLANVFITNDLYAFMGEDVCFQNGPGGDGDGAPMADGDGDGDTCPGDMDCSVPIYLRLMFSSTIYYGWCEPEPMRARCVWIDKETGSEMVMGFQECEEGGNN